MTESSSSMAMEKDSDASILSHFTSQRSRRQLGLFLGGATFVVLSALITRRALVRRYKATVPAFYQPSNRPARQINAAFEAWEALNIATINVFSIGIMFTGGLLWAFDISTMDDLKRKVRAGIGTDRLERRDEDADEEIQEWIAAVLAKKEARERNQQSKRSDK